MIWSYFAPCAVALFGLTERVPAVVSTSRAPDVSQSATYSISADSASAHPEMSLWDDPAPGALGTVSADRPSITVYRAAEDTRNVGHPRTAVLIAPGGAYAFLATDVEGTQEARWFNILGITAFVLKYRVVPYHHPIPLGDAQRALRLIRARAAEFNIAPDRVGMMGFSAGGHLAATVGTHFDAGTPGSPDPIERQSSRPDFVILGYPVISFQPGVAGPHVLDAYARSGRNLLGSAPDPQLLMALSNELHVTAHTPPTFLYHGTADRLVGVENSVVFYLALRKAGVPAELHTFEHADHGGGLNLHNPVLSVWPTLLKNWLQGRGLLP